MFRIHSYYYRTRLKTNAVVYNNNMNEEINEPKKVVVVATEQEQVKTNNPTKSTKLPEPIKSTNGIRIGNTYIKTLSGPVSLYYLKPSDQVLASELHLFPMIMLFGDAHDSMENTCECAKKVPSEYEQSEHTNCYTISDVKFLQLIDTVASKYPIDFYIETQFRGSSGGYPGFLNYFTSGEFVSSYHQTLRGTEYDKCPTKHIRWHASDSRQMTSLSLHTFADPIVSDMLLKSKLKLSEKYMKNQYIEAQISEILLWLRLIFEDLFNKNFTRVKYYIEGLFDYISLTQFETIENFILFLYDALLDTNDKTKIDINKLTDKIFEIMTIDNSLIYKQIAKQTYEPFKQKSYWQKLFNEHLKNHQTIRLWDWISMYNNNTDIKNNMLKIIYDIKNCAEQNCNFETIDRIDFMSVLILLEVLDCYRNRFFLDMYTITRMLKQPDGGKRSFLSFGYFGDNHVKTIMNLLVSTGKYSLIAFGDNDATNKTESRCINIDVSINLDEELERC